MIRLMLLAAVALGLLLAGCGAPAAPNAPDPVLELLAQHGWKPSGPREERMTRAPADFKLRAGHMPWRIIVDLSLDVGLDPEPYAGRLIIEVRIPVEDVQGGRLESLKQHRNLDAYIWLDPQDRRPVGAYLNQVGKDGELLIGGPGPSLTGRDISDITGLGWPQYYQKHRAGIPSPEVLEAEKPRNAIYDYFRAASAHECDLLWAFLSEQVRAAYAQPAWCDQYSPFASLRVIEIQGYAKADNPYGFVFLGSNDLAEEYFVVLEVKHKAGASSSLTEGINHLLVPVVREGDGQWRLGTAAKVQLKLTP